MALPDDYIDFQITGQVTRLDVDPARGHCAWLFTNKTEKWTEELRFPFLQYACATHLNVDVAEVVPGTYDFSTGSYTRVPNTDKQVQNARRSLMKLLDELKKMR